MDSLYQKIGNMPACSLIYFLLLAVICVSETLEFGFDSATSCTPDGKISRRGRAQLLENIPCDLSMKSFCNLPGSEYPWHAVRRFVHENQGLVKRMYGDVRHIRILREEIQNNEIDMVDLEEAAARYSRDGSRRSPKYIQNDDGKIVYDGNLRNNEVLMEPHFRPMSVSSTTTATAPTASSTSTTTTTTIATTATGTIASTILREKNQKQTVSSNTNINNMTTNESWHPSVKKVHGNAKIGNANSSLESITRDRLQLDDVNIKGDRADVGDDKDKESLVSNSVYEPLPPKETITFDGGNIQIVQSPQFGLENISSNLRTSETGAKSTASKVTGSTAATITATARDESELIIDDKHQSSPPPPSSALPTTTTLLSMRITKKNESESIAATFLKVAASYAANSKNNSFSNFNNSNKINNNKTPVSAVQSNSTTTLLTGEQVLKKSTPTTTSTATTTTTTQSSAPNTVTKPIVFRDGQLFQDTVQKEQELPIINLRGVNACPVKEEVVAPFWANNTRGEVLALLNLYPFEQYVHFEKCTHERKQMYCRDGCRCEQQYRLHRLLAYDPHNECRGIFSDWFRFPSSCICKCYDLPFEYRATSRSPRSENRHPVEEAEEVVKKAIYEHATDDWYRPRDDMVY